MLSADYIQLVKNLVDEHPRTVYNRIQFLHPGALQLMTKGFESAPASKRKMVDLIVDKANQSPNPIAYIHQF